MDVNKLNKHGMEGHVQGPGHQTCQEGVPKYFGHLLELVLRIKLGEMDFFKEWITWINFGHE